MTPSGTWAQLLVSRPDEDFMEGGGLYNPQKGFLRRVQGAAKRELAAILGYEPDAVYENRPGRTPRLQRISRALLEQLRRVL